MRVGPAPGLSGWWALVSTASPRPRALYRVTRAAGQRCERALRAPDGEGRRRGVRGRCTLRADITRPPPSSPRPATRRALRRAGVGPARARGARHSQAASPPAPQRAACPPAPQRAACPPAPPEALAWGWAARPPRPSPRGKRRRVGRGCLPQGQPEVPPPVRRRVRPTMSERSARWRESDAAIALPGGARRPGTGNRSADDERIRVDARAQQPAPAT
eukprot:gene13002-biopygen12479